MKRMIAALTLAALLLGLLGTASAESPVTIEIDGQVQSLAVQPVIINGTTLVPVRGIFENLGGQVAWDGATQTATVTRGTTQVVLRIGEPTISVNGKPVQLTTLPEVINGSTMVPLRVISEALGAEVHWREADRTVDMTTRVGGTLTYGLSSEPQHLLPIYTGLLITDLIFDPLLRFDEQMRPVPSLAQRYSVDGEGQRYTFELRPDVTWHDGNPFTARDVAFTFQTILHPEYNTPQRGALWVLKGVPALFDRYTAIQNDVRAGKISQQTADILKVTAWREWIEEGGLQVQGTHTLSFELEKPHAPALTVLGSVPIIPAHRFEQVEPAQMHRSPEAREPIGTGPYKFVKWVAGQDITLERNADWRWGLLGTRPRINELRFRFFPFMDLGVLLEVGEVDMAYVSPDEALRLLPLNLKQVKYMPGTYTYLGYNLKDPRFADPKVRKAITHAINREDLIEMVLQGYGEGLHSHQMPGRWDYTADVARFDYDLARAEQLLDEAGWAKGRDGIRQKDGLRLEFEITTNSGNKVREHTALMIQQALAKVGIGVTIRLMEWNSFLDYVDSDRKQAYILGWNMGTDPDSTSIFHSAGTFSAMSHYANPEVDRLLDQGLTTPDPEQRAAIYQEISQRLAEDQVYTWLFRASRNLMYHPKVKGIMTDRLGPMGPETHLENWYIDQSVK